MRRVAVVVALAACGDNTKAVLDLPADELALRAKLGIPTDARHAIIFAQTSHLDIDWQHTFDDYYSLFVADAFTQARQILDAQPRAFYSIAEMAYLEQHVVAHPEELAALRVYGASGRLRVVGGGITSPDTFLPETELLARDFLYGTRFAETLGAQPTAAWLPDSFGHGAAAPDVLAAAGFASVAFSRIDGAPTITDYVLDRRTTPLPGSTADDLAQLGSADFVWRGSGGATILAHYLAGTGLYCQGDNIDYREPIEVPGGHVGVYVGNMHAFTDASIDRYIAELSPYARTPYLFVPVGCDFEPPKDELVGYLDGYDARRYGATGVYAVAAPFEDYATLVGFHRDALPTIDHELSPYFMGFYGSRADVKRQTRDAARPFFVAETYATLLGADGAAIVNAAAPELEKLARADHHDFVTGTSADPVVANEQLPLLAEVAAAGQAELAHVAGAVAARIPAPPSAIARALALNASSATQAAVVELDVATTGGAVPNVKALASGVELPLELIEPPSSTTARFRVAASVAPFGWQAIDIVPGPAAAVAPSVALALTDDAGAPATGAAVTHVALANARVHARFDRVNGSFVLASLVVDGTEAIAGPSFVVNDYHDSGGLWRMGHEMPGCDFTPLAATLEVDAVQIVEQGKLRATVQFVGADATREASLGASDGWLDIALVTGAAQATTRTASFALAVPATATLVTSVPGGAATREAQRVYSPTFWAAVDFAQVGGWAIALRQSTGARMDTPGAVELIAARDARQESCDIEGGTGSDTGVHRIEWRIAPAADAVAAAIAAQMFERPLAIVGVASTGGTGLPSDGSLVAISGGGIISAVKPAERGDGTIVRAVRLAGGASATIDLSAFLPHSTITDVDLVERDLAPRVPGDTIAIAPGDAAIASVRLR
jgi:hypothetical protein